MGKVQTSSRGSTKQAGRWTWTGVCVGAGQKETQTAQGSKEHRETWGARGHKGHRAGGDSPAHREYDRTKRKRQIRAQGTKVA